MQQNLGPKEELRLEVERTHKYRGFARVNLAALTSSGTEQQCFNRKKIARLKEIFRIEGFRRLEPKHRIPILVEQGVLDGAIQSAGISAEELMDPQSDPPLLSFRGQITRLHGRHRVQAASELLPEIDSWWTVEIFISDIAPGLRTSLTEEYANEEKPTDGEIYVKIRQYERENNVSLKKRWMARLPDYSRRGLRQLANYRHGELAAAFDQLLVIPGLWDGMKISMLPKIISLKCDEEVLSYLAHIKQVWTKLVSENKAALVHLDQVTVQGLELKAPKYSQHDARELKGKVLGGTLLSNFGRDEREAIWTRLSQIESLIPSLYTFFEDIRYLEASANCLKRLIPPSRDTVKNALRYIFSIPQKLLDQSTAEKSRSVHVETSKRRIDNFDTAYWQLWLFAMRYYGEIFPEPRTENAICSNSRSKRFDLSKNYLPDLAAFAKQQGFISREIEALNQSSADHTIARNALLQARSPDQFCYENATLETSVNLMVGLFANATPILDHSLDPPLVTNRSDAPGKRCGYPSRKAQLEDRKYFFLDNMGTDNGQSGENVTSFFVRRSVCIAFFNGQMKSIPCGAVTKSSDHTQRRAMTEGLEEHYIPRQDYTEPGIAVEATQQYEQEQEILERQNSEKRPTLIATEKVTNEREMAHHPYPENENHKIGITIRVRERGIWRTSAYIDVVNSNTEELDRMILKFRRKNLHIFDTSLSPLTQRNYFETVTSNGSNTILLIPEWELIERGSAGTSLRETSKRTQ